MSVLHNTLITCDVSTCLSLSMKLLDDGPLGCNILEIHYNSRGIPPRGADMVCFNDSIHLGFSHILAVIICLGPSQVVSFHHIENTFCLGLHHMIGFPSVLERVLVWLCLSHEREWHRIQSGFLYPRNCAIFRFSQAKNQA